MAEFSSWKRLEAALARAYQGETLSKEEMAFLLSLKNREQKEDVFKAARDLRRNYFEDTVFLYGFLYISTYCRNNCTFCFFRNSNSECQRYRKSQQEIVEAACRLAASGVHLIDLTMGEDPEYFQNGYDGLQKLLILIKAVKETTQLPIMVSPGVVPKHVLDQFFAVGANWYACYQETHKRTLFKQLRLGQSYEKRINTKRRASEAGLLIEEGILCGVGESVDDIVESITQMDSMNADQVRAMTFVPQKGTPMQKSLPPDPTREMMIISVMRLVFPDRLIPATLDVGGLAGLKERLDAGANVITSLVPPGRGLAGVAQSSLDIEDAKRTVSSVLPILDNCGLRLGCAEDYSSWLQNRLKDKDQFECRKRAVCR